MCGFKPPTEQRFRLCDLNLRYFPWLAISIMLVLLRHASIYWFRASRRAPTLATRFAYRARALEGMKSCPKKPLVSYDRHYKGAPRFLEFRDLFEQRDQIIARARELNLDNDHDYGYFTRSIVPQIESIDARVDFLTRDDADLEKAIEKSAKSYQALARWDMRADRAFESLKGAIGGIGISAIGGILTGITYLLAGPGQTYIVFTGLMLAGLIGVGYSLLYWFPIIVRYAYLFVVRSFKSDNEGSVYPD